MSNFFYDHFFARSRIESPYFTSHTPLPLRGPSFSKSQPFPTFTLVSFSFSRFLLLSTGLVTSINPYRFSPPPLSPFSTLLLQEFFTLLHPRETTFFPSFLPPSIPPSIPPLTRNVCSLINAFLVPRIRYTTHPLPKDKIEEQKDIRRDNKGVGVGKSWLESIERIAGGEKNINSNLSLAAALLNIQFIELWSESGGSFFGGGQIRPRPRIYAALCNAYTLKMQRSPSFRLSCPLSSRVKD